MFLYLKDVVTLKIDPEACIGCGFCLEVCPRCVLAVKDRKVFIAVKDACLECGACRIACVHKSLSWKYPKSGCGVTFKHG